MDEVPARASRFALGEVPSLDGLRGVSVLLVMLLHFDWLGCGWIGVQFFFVLSGFLISANFFLSQESLQPTQVIAAFFTKRFLRIFPLYYLALALYFSLEASPFFPALFAEKIRAQPRALLVHGLFLQNFAAAYFGGAIRVLAHFWSLAVEEQFYLVFPFLALFLRRRSLALVSAALVIGVPVLRASIGDTSVYKNTLTQADAFACGILLSLGWSKIPFRQWCHKQKSKILLGTYAYGATLLLSGLILLHCYHARGITVGNSTLGYEISTAFGSHVWVYTAMDLLGTALTLHCLLNPRGWIFAHRALRYLGRISFGLYVYHYPIAFALEENFHFKFKSAKGIMLFCGYFSLTLAAASLSYFCWELKFLRLKPMLTRRLRGSP